MGKDLHKVFSTVVKCISQELTPLVESGSEVSHFIPDPKNISEVTKLSDNIKKPWLKATLKDIKNLINNQTFLIEDQNEGEPVTPYMDVYKEKIQSDGSLDNLNREFWLEEICRIRKWMEILGHHSLHEEFEIFLSRCSQT